MPSEGQTEKSEEYHVIVHGNVHGVGFRAMTRRIALQVGVTGIVRNCPEGTVEIIAQGSSTQLNDFLEQLRNSPGTGRIDSMDTQIRPEKTHYSTFQIVH